DYLRGEPDLHADAAELVGQLMAWLATLRAMSLAIAGSLAQGGNPVVEASLVKDLGTELEQDIALRIAADLARHPDRPVPAALLETVAYLLQVYPTFSLRGGTREILRGIIARGLGLR
ncbi:MAG: acyl-CoA dehydrogenase, partial [Comamonadaceae bacterium]